MKKQYTSYTMSKRLFDAGLRLPLRMMINRQGEIYPANKVHFLAPNEYPTYTLIDLANALLRMKK